MKIHWSCLVCGWYNYSDESNCSHCDVPRIKTRNYIRCGCGFKTADSRLFNEHREECNGGSRLGSEMNNYIVSPEQALQEMRRERTMYVNGTCTECGADVQRANQTQHSNWHSTFIHRASVKDGFNMSAVKWCDVGNHAFKASADGAQSIDVMQRTDKGEERVTMDICGEHAFPVGNANPTMRAVEASYQKEVGRTYNGDFVD